MAILPTQKFRFFGGEVSPNLYHSADMEQYGKWFSKAENIRFDTLGAFRNRPGFNKIALSKVSNGTNIKLLSFSFSNNESYLIEMGWVENAAHGYFRFFKDGQPIYIGGDPNNSVYEVAHDMQIVDGDIKYAQSGDVLYLTNGVNPVCTLTRNDTTGYNWTCTTFAYKDNCVPLDEINTDDTKSLSITRQQSSAEQYSSDDLSYILYQPGRYIGEFEIEIVDTGNTSHVFAVPTKSNRNDSYKPGQSFLWSSLVNALNNTGLYGFTASISGGRLYLYRSDGVTNPVASVYIKKIVYSYKIVGNEDWITVTNVATQQLIAPSPSVSYIVTSTGHDFFANKEIGEVFAVQQSLGPGEATFATTNAAVNTTSAVIVTNGTFQFTSTGNWKGEIVCEYSLDGSTGWKTLYTLNSPATNNPHNVNNAITISDKAETYYVRLRVTSVISVDTYQLEAYLYSQKYYVNSYYSIISKTSDTVAVCSCIKNITIANNSSVSGIKDFYEQFFSVSKGYPAVVGIYQNRLFLGRDYYLYGSKTNQFDDFYLPYTVSANDPLSMSLLANKYNRIKNILTIRKFFAFTEEGEFGIASEGALTQTNKTLLPISYHGSNDCLPILAGNIALFVDSTENKVRMFKYSYETDAYEANDSSIFLEQLLNGKKIVTTDYSKSKREAYFLDDDGAIWVFKIIPEQEVFAWSHWKYAPSGKITNMRVVPSGGNDDLYIAVEDENLDEKRIEIMSTDKFYDSTYVFTPDNRTKRFFTPFAKGTELIVYLENTEKRYKVIVQDNGLVETPEYADYIVCHYAYTATATLLSPAHNLAEGVFTTYNKGKPFKVYFNYQDSFGFKVGVEEEEKMLVKFNSGDRPESTELTSGKRNVLIPSRYDGSSRVTFIQDRPYNMSINNVLIDMDYGGK